eukprot:3939468-Rhodomonas_salina.1
MQSPERGESRLWWSLLRLSTAGVLTLWYAAGRCTALTLWHAAGQRAALTHSVRLVDVRH